VTAYDPAAAARAALVLPQVRYASSAVEAARGADVLLVLTEWPEFAAVDPAELGRVVARRNVADGRHALDVARWRAAGWRYQALGSGSPPLEHRQPESQRSMQSSSSSVSTGLVT
jgi:UDPglucose 6-dehydrogenase